MELMYPHSVHTAKGASLSSQPPTHGSLFSTDTAGLWVERMAHSTRELQCLGPGKKDWKTWKVDANINIAQGTTWRPSSLLCLAAVFSYVLSLRITYRIHMSHRASRHARDRPSGQATTWTTPTFGAMSPGGRETQPDRACARATLF